MNRQWWLDITTTLQNILSPAYCSNCWKILEQRIPLCASCYEHIEPLASHLLKVPPYHPCTVYSVGAYKDPLMSLIRAKQQRSIISAYHLGHLMAHNTPANLLQPGDILVPIPLHWQRYAWRGFNQTHAMAQVVSSYHNLPIMALLKRSKMTAYQATTASKDARVHNVHKAFTWNSKYNPQSLQDHRIVLIDDLLTSGSTLQAAITEIHTTYRHQKLTPPSIIAYVAARVV